MSRHSKNNTAGSVFTYAERKALRDYGTQQERLSKDSMLLFHYCFLCMKDGIGREMTCCSRGHVACHECQISSMLKQKETYKQNLEGYNKKLQLKQIEEKKHLEKQERDYELAYRKSQEIIKTVASSSSIHPQGAGGSAAAIENAAYWTKDIEHHKESIPLVEPDLKIECLANQRHSLCLKSLYKVYLRLDCPVCTKKFTGNAIKVMMNKACGHLICKDCLSKVHECIVCHVPLANVIELYKEGTGYAGGGGKIAKRYDAAFYC